ncbi:hypothetical protein [Nocardiopsis dassonvillei]|uniref:hypothetical protein n=1 Tax=Nocardiopsis dassonvillei TaxID=2014 RepID=UPI00157C9FAC|nr:hypothetical protein [Nocardiopsis dassonvillei]
MNEPVSETTRLLAQQLRPNGDTAKKLREAEWKKEEDDKRWRERRLKELLKTKRNPTRYDYAAAEKKVADEYQEMRDARYVAARELREQAQDDAIAEWKRENSSAVKLLRFSEELRKKEELDANDRHTWQYLARTVHTNFRVKVPPLEEVLDAEDNPLDDLFE